VVVVVVMVVVMVATLKVFCAPALELAMLHDIVSLLMLLSAGGAQRAGPDRVRGGAVVCQRAD
jgi:hypothetical protein